MPVDPTLPAIGSADWGPVLNDAIEAIDDGTIDLSTVTATGDLLVGSGPGAVSRLGVGSNGTVLTALSTTSLGVVWDQPNVDYINAKNYGATGNGTTSDSTAINNALAAAPVGGTVYLPPGTYAVTAPLQIPPQVRLLGAMGTQDTPTTVEIKPLSSFSGGSVIYLTDEATGGWSITNTDIRIENLTIDGSSLAGGNSVVGIYAYGYVHGTYIENVQIRYVGSHGILTASNSSGSPNTWRVSRVILNNCGGDGVNAQMTDCTWRDVLALGNTGSGFLVSASPNTHFDSCRAEWNLVDGWTISGSQPNVQGSGGCIFSGCSTDRNAHNGINITATGTVPLLFNGLMLRRDGYSSTSSGYAGFALAGSTVPVIISGVTCFTGTNDDGTGNATPQYGFSITATTNNVVLSNGFFQAISAGIHDDGSNVNWFRNPNVMTATGATNAQVFDNVYSWSSQGGVWFQQISDSALLQLNNSGTGNYNNPLLRHTASTATSVADASHLWADTNFRWQKDVSGYMQWGSGSAAYDTSLYRSAAGVLTSNASLVLGGYAQVPQYLNLVNYGSTPATVSGSTLLYSTAGVPRFINPQGASSTAPGTVQVVTAAVTVSNSTAATALQSYTVPANDPAAGAVYKVAGYGVFSTTGTPTLQFIMYWGGTGGTAIATVPAITTASGVTNLPFRYEGEVVFRTATTCWAFLKVVIATATTGTATTYEATPTSVTTVTTSATEALAVGVTWGTASASNTISIEGGYVQRIA